MNAPPDLERSHIRQSFMAWRAGAGLQDEDVARLAEAAGLHFSANRLRNLGRHSDRGVSISAEELASLISAWADEQQAARRRT